MKQLLKKLEACKPSIIWAGDKSWQEIYDTCHRGDWLSWLFERTNPKDKRLLTLAQGHCANTVRHLIKDSRFIAAVDAAISFGNGEISEKELDNAYDAAVFYSATDAAYYAALYAAADAADADAAAASKTKNQLATADICRKYLPMEVWKIK